MASSAPLPLGRGLLIPAEGTPALGMAFTRYLNSTYQAFLSLGTKLPEPLREAHHRAVTAARRALADNARSLLGCFASPTVGIAIHAAPLRHEMPAFAARIDAALATATPHLLLELAIRRLLRDGETLDWPLAPPLASLSLWIAAHPPAGATALRFAAGRLTALAGDAPVASLELTPDAVAAAARESPAAAGEGAPRFRLELPYRRVGGVTRFATINHNPIAEFEAHPDKAGNAIDLGDHPVEEWVGVLEQAFALIAAHLPGVHAEMAMMLHEVIPVGYHRERHLSASYREAIGTCYLTLHPNLMTMAEALVHEFQHNKMNVASYSCDVLQNPFYPRFPSPVRPDPRPLWGILLAVHAFLPVAVLYRNMRASNHPSASAPDFERRLAEVDLKNHEGMEMLRRHAQWTPAGRALMDELEDLDRAHMAERAARGL